MAPLFAPAQNPITGNSFTGLVDGPGFAVGPQGCVGLQVADITLSSAQILALQTTPVTLIPAPGLAGWMIVPYFAVLRLTGGSAAYTDVGGAVSFNIGSSSSALAANTIFLTTTSPNRATQRYYFLNSLDTAGNPPTDDNAPLTISKITNNFAAGNGTMHITIYYTIEPSV